MFGRCEFLACTLLCTRTPKYSQYWPFHVVYIHIYICMYAYMYLDKSHTWARYFRGARWTFGVLGYPACDRKDFRVRALLVGPGLEVSGTGRHHVPGSKKYVN